MTQDDIDRGIRLKCELCPVALAIRRVVLPYLTVHVKPNYVEFSHQVMTTVKIGHGVNRFLWQYDKGFAVAPFEFHIYIPEHFLRS